MGERLARHHTVKQPDTCSQYRLGPRQHTKTPKQPQRSHCLRGRQAVVHRADATRQSRCPPKMKQLTHCSCFHVILCRMMFLTSQEMVMLRSMLGKLVIDVLEAEVESPLPVVVL